MQIRGDEPGWSNLTIDGINVPSPESGVRQVKLDNSRGPGRISGNRQDAASQHGRRWHRRIGRPENQEHRNSPTLQLTGLGGWTPIVNTRYITQFGATLGERFGPNQRLGILVGGIYDYNGRGIDDLEPTPTAGSSVPSYDSMDMREYRYDRSRLGLRPGNGGLQTRRILSLSVGAFFNFKDYGDTVGFISLNNGECPGYSTSDRRPDFGIAASASVADDVFSFVVG